MGYPKFSVNELIRRLQTRLSEEDRELPVMLDSEHTYIPWNGEIIHNEYFVSIQPCQPVTEDLGIGELDLKVRTYNALRRNNIKTIGDLKDNTADDLLDIRNFGYNSLSDVVNKLSRYGWKLKEK